MKNLFASSLHFIINVYNPHNILTVHYVIGHKHIKLPLVFKDVGLFRAFSTDTNELSIPTRCVLCLLMVHQMSLVPHVPNNLGRGLPLSPHPQIDLIYTVCEKWTKNLGRALPPPSIGQNPKEQLLFSGDLPQEHPRC